MPISSQTSLEILRTRVQRSSPEFCLLLPTWLCASFIRALEFICSITGERITHSEKAGWNTSKKNSHVTLPRLCPMGLTTRRSKPVRITEPPPQMRKLEPKDVRKLMWGYSEEEPRWPDSLSKALTDTTESTKLSSPIRLTDIHTSWPQTQDPWKAAANGSICWPVKSQTMISQILIRRGTNRFLRHSASDLLQSNITRHLNDQSHGKSIS